MGRNSIIAILFVFVFSACGHKAPPKPPEDKKPVPPAAAPQAEQKKE
jgi:predicted small lipoprotein YifL